MALPVMTACRRFEGPPTGERITQRQAEIAAIEARLEGAGTGYERGAGGK